MPLKKISLIFLTLLSGFSCLAQKAALDQIENADASKYKPFTIEIESKKKYAVSTHIRHIQIVDARSDKSKLGITRAGEKLEDRRFVFAKEFTPYLQEKINRLCHADKEAKDTVVFVINNLWLYQTLSPGSFLKQQALGVSNN